MLRKTNIFKSNLPPMDKSLLITVLTLVVVGLVVLSSASTVLSYERFNNSYHYLFRQLFFGAIPGLILMYICSKIDFHFWQKNAPLFVLASVGLLVAVLIPGIGNSFGGARRWIDLRLFLFQPGELVKLAMTIYLASWYDKRKMFASELYYGFLPVLVIVGLVAGLIILQPDLGTMLVLICIAAAMFFIGGVRFKYLIATAMVGLAAFWVLVQAESYRLQRFLVFLNPMLDIKGISYQINQALLAIGSGGWFGVGLGQSRQKYNYLPEPIGDSIFAIMSEELGFIRILAVLALFVFLSFRGFKIARKAPDTFGRLLAAGLTAWIVVQAIINIGGITAIMPLTGIPLPFISFGSTALVVSLAGMGILLNISRFLEQ